MIAVIQRVRRAHVRVGDSIVGRIGRGFLVLAGARKGDPDDDPALLAEKIVHLRVFEDDAERMNRSVIDVGGAVLLVSQFTLLADLRRGRRPGFEDAELPERARSLVARLGAEIRARGVAVEEGRFGESMRVVLANEGPATFVLDTRDLRAPRSGGGRELAS